MDPITAIILGLSGTVIQSIESASAQKRYERFIDQLYEQAEGAQVVDDETARRMLESEERAVTGQAAATGRKLGAVEARAGRTGSGAHLARLGRLGQETGRSLADVRARFGWQQAEANWRAREAAHRTAQGYAGLVGQPQPSGIGKAVSGIAGSLPLYQNLLKKQPTDRPTETFSDFTQRGGR